MTIQCFGYKCQNVQEGKALFNQLEKLGYSPSSFTKIHKSQLCLFIDPDEMKMFWFAAMHEHIFGVNYLTLVQNVTQMVTAVRGLDRKYDCADNDGFERQYQGHFELYIDDQAVGKVVNNISTQAEHCQITVDNRNKALHAINNMKDYPVELTIDLTCKDSRGTIATKELQALDGTDIREVLGKKQKQHGNMYISEEALADVESWVNMQSPRYTPEEIWDVPLADLGENIVADKYVLTDENRENTPF